MSARAAWRLESLGFIQVFRYTAGKADWTANGLPIEGKLAHAPRVVDLARRDVPTCSLREHVGEVRHRLQMAGWDVGVVVNDAKIVFGLVWEKVLNAADPQTNIEQVMDLNVKTYRLNAAPEKAANYMRQQDVDSVLVTTSDGELVGLLKREDADRAVNSPQQS